MINMSPDPLVPTHSCLVEVQAQSLMAVRKKRLTRWLTHPSALTFTKKNQETINGLFTARKDSL